MAQQHTITWVNPTTNTDGTPFAATDFAGIGIVIDGSPAVDVPAASEITTFDMSTLAVWPTLKSGSHTVGITVVNKEGNSSALSNVVTFPVLPIPSAPSGLAVS